MNSSYIILLSVLFVLYVLAIVSVSLVRGRRIFRAKNMLEEHGFLDNNPCRRCEGVELTCVILNINDSFISPKYGHYAKCEKCGRRTNLYTKGLLAEEIVECIAEWNRKNPKKRLKSFKLLP